MHWEGAVDDALGIPHTVPHTPDHGHVGRRMCDVRFGVWGMGRGMSNVWDGGLWDAGRGRWDAGCGMSKAGGAMSDMCRDVGRKAWGKGCRT